MPECLMKGSDLSKDTGRGEGAKIPGNANCNILWVIVNELGAVIFNELGAVISNELGAVSFNELDVCRRCVPAKYPFFNQKL